MNKSYDVIVVGSGPGGYETAIRATQLGFSTAIVEMNKLGGVCLNVGCIPTKALLKSAELADYATRLAAYGLVLDGTIQPDFESVIGRSRKVATKMNRGVAFLMKKNGVDVHYGRASLMEGGALLIEPSTDMDGKSVGVETQLSARHIILATGARAKDIPSLPVDGEQIIDYKGALLQTTAPKRLVIVGAGAIGVEFAYFYHHMGTEVTVIELMDRLVPIEDADVSAQLAKSFKKSGIRIMTGASVTSVESSKDGLKVSVKGRNAVECDQVLSAVGVAGNIESLGLEEMGIATDRGFIVTDEYGRTSAAGVYAIGDVAGPPWLAHKASHEGAICVEKIAGHDVRPMDKGNIPGCTYCQPQIASVGLTEQQALDQGLEIRVGKFPLSASGKATAAGHTDGFAKILFDARYGELLGCHIIGHDATELIAEVVTARTLETTYHEILDAVHPHPTLSEAILEAARAAVGQSINI